MNGQCPRCLSSMFPRVGNGCAFCEGKAVEQHPFGCITSSVIVRALPPDRDMARTPFRSGERLPDMLPSKRKLRAIKSRKR